MSGFFKLYPDRFAAALRLMVGDGAALLWIALCAFIGHAIYSAIVALQAIGTGVIATGRTLDGGITAAQQTLNNGLEGVMAALNAALRAPNAAIQALNAGFQALNNIPLIGGHLPHIQVPLVHVVVGRLRVDLGRLHEAAHALIVTGQNEQSTIHDLALRVGIVAALVPLFFGLWRYLSWRREAMRGFRGLDRFMGRPGSHAVPATLEILAGRALYTLPYERLLQYSPDPVAEWREGRYFNLAQAAMAAEGLDLRRYLRRMEKGITSSRSYPIDSATPERPSHAHQEE